MPRARWAWSSIFETGPCVQCCCLAFFKGPQLQLSFRLGAPWGSLGLLGAPWAGPGLSAWNHTPFLPFLTSNNFQHLFCHPQSAVPNPSGGQHDRFWHPKTSQNRVNIRPTWLLKPILSKNSRSAFGPTQASVLLPSAHPTPSPKSMKKRCWEPSNLKLYFESLKLTT